MNQWVISEPKFESDVINAKLRVAPWEGHRRFAYDFMRYLNPGSVVELGTHYGCSFFTFCQAVKDFDLTTKLYAIDTWEGDEQAGFYGEDVYVTVTSTVENIFPNIDITLLRKTFDEALNDFEDNSIEVIHIDGLHTFEAVSHDFETWLPKLKEDGVIMFHDVFSPLGYGSNQFWNDIKNNYPSYEFKHSWGLGLLFPKGAKVHEGLLDENINDKILYYTYRSLYEFEVIKTQDLQTMVFERDKAIASNEKLIKEKDEIIRQNDILIQERDKAIASNEKLIKEKDEIIRQNDVMIQERDKAVASNEKLIKEKDEIIRQNDIMIQERDIALASSKEMIESRDEALLTSKMMIDDRDSALEATEKMIQERDTIITTLEKQLATAKNNISILEKKVKEQNDGLIATKNELIQKQELIDYYQSKKIILNFRKK
ncbi:class I SAM-dependent methyltransferase [Paenibacillus melissococcoides]|uniref:Class I SAM-dependent methyltransferase n=1 Tax=Paenibacillus melissococcoides TaxID=2912268 RepID=A0ABM9GB31_9BACL|nr:MULTISPECIES: class I SAM-dependent methyltransferase [Paenibacillus]MEB9892826.1 class I SAM-dependent methyltransferase [Bacillus cereus]CAH8248953.1 class I SAM-dependent methyltransferase [Paenibacillus melissococcoides]CAH8720776.1 class I SAM-dependent methyltransferase [Paenibacillus melissococcoides]CAH8720886.1 class I SAM-dependent methyltransferase [Paenibacillus melissococcoides]GIO80552.1 hypothetical protein J6TS7_41620 [Paenibacillus dendritiformis]